MGKKVRKILVSDAEIDAKFSFKDSDGNLFYCKNRYLFLYQGQKKLAIGKIIYHGGNLIYSKQENEDDVFRKINAWSIPYEIVKRVDKVTFYTKDKFYRIDTIKIHNNSMFLHFKSSGYELKVYVPKDYWDIEERK